jgi:hypothetical protein
MNSLTSDGDVSGTPAGVDLRMKPPQYLKGDVFELGLKDLRLASTLTSISGALHPTVTLCLPNRK